MTPYKKKKKNKKQWNEGALLKRCNGVCLEVT